MNKGITQGLDKTYTRHGTVLGLHDNPREHEEWLMTLIERMRCPPAMTIPGMGRKDTSGI